MSSWITSSEIGAYLDGVGATNSATLDAIGERSSDIIRDALRNELKDPLFDLYRSDELPPDPSSRTYHGDYSAELVIHPHVGAIVSVTDRYSGLVVDPLLYDRIIEGSTKYKLLKIGNPWIEGSTLGWNGVFIIETAWSYGIVPESIKELTLEVAVEIWRSRKSGFGDTIGTAQGGAITVLGRLDSLQRAVIKNYVEQYRRESRYE